MTQYATMVPRCWIGSATLVACALAAPAEAQFLEAFEENRWGVHLSFTPEWRAPEQTRYLLGADDATDWQGSDFSVGFVRGRATGGEWGLALIRQRVKADSTLCLGVDEDDACYDPVEAARGLRLQGFEFHWFTPFGSFAEDRVQVGINAAAGAGWYQGSVRRPAASPGDPGLAVEAPDVLRFRGPDGPEGMPIPMFRIEFAVAGVVAPGLKVIGSGGYGLPGSRRIGVAVSYFPQFGS